MKGMKGELMDTEFVINPFLHGQISQVNLYPAEFHGNDWN
jgi:hypothetical protein